MCFFLLRKEEGWWILKHDKHAGPKTEALGADGLVQSQVSQKRTSRPPLSEKFVQIFLSSCLCL